MRNAHGRSGQQQAAGELGAGSHGGDLGVGATDGDGRWNRSDEWLRRGRYITKRDFAHQYIRPHYRENTVSRSICEVKHGQDRLVLWWGTTWEVRLLYIFFPFCPLPMVSVSLFFAAGLN